MAYSNNTIHRAEQILGYSWSDTTGERTYPVVEGIVYTDVFTGTAPDGYTAAFNGRTNNIDYYNQLILQNYRPSTCPKTVTLNLTWGSDTFKTDIDGLLTWLEANPSTSQLADAGVKSKKIEDFTITVNDAETTINNIDIILNDGYGFYIRKPLIVSIAPEQRGDEHRF